MSGALYLGGVMTGDGQNPRAQLFLLIKGLGLVLVVADHW